MIVDFGGEVAAWKEYIFHISWPKLSSVGTTQNKTVSKLCLDVTLHSWKVKYYSLLFHELKPSKYFFFFFLMSVWLHLEVSFFKIDGSHCWYTTTWVVQKDISFNISLARAREKEAGRLWMLHCPLNSICPPDTAGSKLLQ